MLLGCDSAVLSLPACRLQRVVGDAQQQVASISLTYATLLDIRQPAVFRDWMLNPGMTAGDVAFGGAASRAYDLAVVSTLLHDVVPVRVCMAVVHAASGDATFMQCKI